jgi:hypothetical protein
MSVSIRRATPTDTPVCGPILFSAFKSLAEYHRLPLDIASVEVRSMITSMLIGHSKFYGVVAEENGRVFGSNFIDFPGGRDHAGPDADHGRARSTTQALPEPVLRGRPAVATHDARHKELPARTSITGERHG